MNGRFSNPRILCSLAAGAALACTCFAAEAQERAASPVAPSLVAIPAPPQLEPMVPASMTPSAAGPSRGKTSAPPVQRTRRSLEFDQSFDAGARGPAPGTILIGQRDGQKIILPDYLKPSEAFQAELRRKSLDSQRAQLYANIPYEMPELLEDDFIRREQSRVAESLMGSAVEKAISVAFQGGVRRESSVSIRPMFATVDHGMKVDGSPSWSYKIRAPRSGLRLDLPLTPRPLRIQAWRDLHGTDRTPVRLGGGLTIDPFDQSVRCGVSFEF